MKIIRKRAWSLLLAAAMVVTLLPAAGVYAATEFDTELMTNGGAESAGISGWTDDTGQGRWNSSTVYSTWALPAAGSKYFYFYNPSMDYLSGTMSQEIALSGTEGSGLFSAISAGSVSIRFSASMFQGISADNEVKAILEEYAADGSLLKTSQVVNTTSNGTAMGSYQINTQVNPGTRKFKMVLSATLTKGGYAQFDQVSLKLVNASSGSAPVFGSDFPASAETDAGVPYTANFTISDADAGDIDHLAFSASSTNVNLVPAANITMSGSGSSRTLRIAPAGNLSGEADITVTASDGTKSAEKTFHFIVHKVISMDTNLVENGNGTSGLTGWSGNMVNITPTGSGFISNDPNSIMSQNIDISKFSPLIDGGESEFLLSAVFEAYYGAVHAQFYTDIACTKPIGSSVRVNNSNTVQNTISLKDKIPATAKGVKITFDNTCPDYDNVEVSDISFEVVNNFPVISSITAKTTDLSALTIPVYAYYTTSDATLTASSSDQTIVPDGSILVGGSGFNRSISFTPLKNGSFTISLVLNDGSKSVSASFAVTAHEPAKVISVLSPQGFYSKGENIDFTVQFNYPVTGGTSSGLPLTIGGVSAAASYLSSTADSITYRYTVGGSDSGAVTVGAAIDDASSPITGTAEYDVETEISTGATGVTVVQAPQVTSTAVGGSAVYGTKITVTAALDCAEVLSGVIQFKANGSNLGSPVAVIGNSASYETTETALSAGAASITAVYVPSGTNFHFTSLTSNTYAMNISRKAIEITPLTATKICGTADPVFDYQITNGALAGSESLIGSLSREVGEDVGEYEITQGTVTNENNPNYDITFVTGIKLTVIPAPVVNAVIIPDTGSFDRKTINQADIQTTITWGSATCITDIKAGGTSIGTDNYSVSGNTITIKKGYLALQATGSLALTVFFDQGNPATLNINIADTTPSAVPVTGITVTGAGGADSITVGKTLQMQTNISPDNASDKSVDWSIESGSGATVDEAGLLTAAAAGTVIVRATAKDGSGIYGEKTIIIAGAEDMVEISIAQSPVKSILHAITFGLFFDDTIDVSINSTGGMADHYEYQIVADGDTFDSGSAWTQGTSFSINPDFKGRVYARAVYSGGTTYTSVKALVVDNTEPTIIANYDASSASIAVSVTDDGAGVREITYQVGSGAEQTIDLEPSETRDITTQHDFTISGLPDGQYDVVIGATDNSGNGADAKTVSIDPSPAVVDASISPAAKSYDLASSSDVKTNITWNSASYVTDVVYDADSTPLREIDDYVVTGSVLTIKSSYLQTLGFSAGDSADFTVSFDAGKPVTFTVDFVENHTPSNNADLSDLTVNGTTVTGFDPDTTDYGVELPYGTAAATVGAEADDPHASVNITQADFLPGTATIEVLAENSTDTKNYKVNFTLADPAPTAHSITVQNDGRGSGSATPPSATAGQTVTLRSLANNGYRFMQWQVISPAGLSITNNTFTMPDEAVTVKAIFKANSSSGGGNGSGSSGGSFVGSAGTPTAATEKQPDQPVTAVVSITATVGTSGTFRATIPDQAVTDAIAKAQADAKALGKTANGISVALNITAPQGTAVLSAILSQTALKALVDAGVISLEINGLPVSVSFDQTALRAVQSQSSGSVTITAASGQNLSDDAKTMIGGRPVFNIKVGYTANGSANTVTNLGGGSATVSIPYTPAPGESVDYLYGVYVDGDGSAIRLDGSAYDANSGCLIFTTNHFSIYGVGYTAPSAKFTDISNHWAKESIDCVVGRGLLTGTSKTTFAPDTAITRGILVTALSRLAGADVSGYKTSSFTDVKDGSTFQPYIEWAYKKGIIKGMGNGQFAPNRTVTHEEIAVILQNYAKVTGYTLPVTRVAVIFADNNSIGSTCKDAVKAMQQAGIMLGVNNKFNPKSNVTRAEVSTMLRRYIKLTIDPATAQGWAKNDSGQWMYFDGSKALTGWQTVGGKVYCFDSSGGAYANGWRKNDKGEWFFLSSDGSALVGWCDIGVNNGNKRYYFDANAVMASGKWLQIDGKWYYFYTDGSLAKNATIDGWEVDENGVRKTE